MPVRTAFKRSLLNSQPMPPREQLEAVKNLTDVSTEKPGSGFDVASLGFSDYIERQVNTLRDSPDAVSLSGVQDSSAALRVSSDPQRPELILLTRLFENAPADVREILRLRGFEACLDEADYQRFLALVSNSKTITRDYEKRLKEANNSRVEVSSILDGLAEIASSVDSFRDSMDFLLNSSKIHLASVKYLTSYPSRYTSTTEVWQPTLLRTFAGLQESLELSNSSLVATLLTSLVLPGSIRYEVTKGSDSNKNRFLVPRVKSDPASQLLAKISQIDVTTPDGFSQAEALLPSDPAKRLSIIAEALSYELTVSAGLRSIKQPNISSYLVNKVGITTSPLLDPPPTSTYSSVIRTGDSLPLESKDYVVDGNTFEGALSSLVDPAVESGELNFKDLSEYSKRFTTSLNSYVAEIKKLRLLDDATEELSSVSLIKGAAGTVLQGLSSLVTYTSDSNFDSIDNKQVSQAAYLKSLADSDSGNGVLDPKYKTFMKYLGNKDFVLDISVSEPDSPSAATTQRSRTRSNVDNSQTSNVSTSIQSSKSDENRNIQTSVTVSGGASSRAAVNVNVTAGTAGGIRAGNQVSTALGSSTRSSLGSARGSSTNKPVATGAGSTRSQQTASRANLESFEAELPPTDYYSGAQGSSYLDPFGSTNTSFDIENVDLSVNYTVSPNSTAQAGISAATARMLGITDKVTQSALADLTVSDILGDSVSTLLGSNNSFVGGITSNGSLDGSSTLAKIESSVSSLTIDGATGISANLESQLAGLSTAGSSLSSNIAGGANKVASALSDAFGSLSTSVVSDAQAAIASAVSALSFATPKIDDAFNVCDSSSPFLDIPVTLPRLPSPSLSLPDASKISSAASAALSSISAGLGSIEADTSALENLSLSLTSPNVKISSGISGLVSKLEQAGTDVLPDEIIGGIVPQGLSSDLSLSVNGIGSTASSALSALASGASKSVTSIVDPTTQVAGSNSTSLSSLDYTTAGKTRAVTNAAEKILKSEDVLGLSIDSNGLQKYAKIMQKTTDVDAIARLTTEPASVSKSKSTANTFSLSDIRNNILGVDGASLRSRASGRYGLRSRVYGKSTVPDTRAATSVSADYLPYLAVFEPADDSSLGSQFSTSFEGVLSSITEDSTSRNPLLTGSIRNFVKSILNAAGEKANDPDSFINLTGCYGLSRSALEFLFYSMCLSMLPSITCVNAGYRFANNRKDFDISCRVDTESIGPNVSLFDSVGQLEGSINDVIKSLETLNVDKSIFSAIGYCHACTNLVKERVAVVESYVNSYTTAVTNLTSLSTSKTVGDSLKKLRERQALSILSDITVDTVSASQLSFINLRGPAALPSQPRMTRISEKVTTALIQDLAKNDSRNSVYIAVGIPAKSLEYMRRSPVAEGEQDFDIEGKEYLEVEVTKRDVQYSDLVMKKTSVRFCPNLTVFPQFTRAANIKEAAFDFIYLCYTGKKWETKSFSDAIEFVKSTTGLTVAESLVIVYNHVFDSVGKLAVMSLTGTSVDENFATRSEAQMTLEGADFYRKVLIDQVVSQALPVDSVLPGSYLVRGESGYTVLPFSRLPSSLVTRTNEPSHRLLYSIASDPLFSYESYYGQSYTPPPFERVYMCLVDPDEFVIDKFATVSTPSGRSSYEYLVAAGKITESEEVANLNDRESSGALDGNEFAVKASLVTG